MPACQWSAKLVFLSSTTHTGNLGGLGEADAICQALAGAAGLTANGQAFRAWLSDSDKTAAERIAHADSPYILVNGTKIADTWSDLVDGSLDHAIDLDEHGASPINFHYVWTGTAWNGAVKKPGSLCPPRPRPPPGTRTVPRFHGQWAEFPRRRAARRRSAPWSTPCGVQHSRVEVRNAEVWTEEAGSGRPEEATARASRGR